MTPSEPQDGPPVESGRDPAKARFAAINGARVMGVASVIIGMLMATNRLLPEFPDWVGYILIGSGLLDVFVVPTFLARKWRSPR